MRARHVQHGQISILLALSIVVLIAAAGLAIDTGLSYIVKAKLNAATDSAALAGASAATIGNTEAEQRASAQAAARRFFNANYPANYMLTSVTMDDAVVTFDKGKITVDVTARATLPVSLMGVLNANPLAPGVASQTIRKDLDMVLVLDTSGSLSGQEANVQSSAITFLNQFNIQQDRVGLVHFSYGAVVDDAINTVSRGFNRSSMVGHINAFDFDGSTASAEGMWNARDQLNGIAAINRSSLRVIVFFSDGAPNSWGSTFQFKLNECLTPTGTITSDDDGSGTPGGLYRIDRTATAWGGTCTPSSYGSSIPARLSRLPDYYNAHDTLKEFPVVTSTPRAVDSTVNYKNVNRAARNLVEAMAAKSRTEGIYVFTLGLGAALKSGTGYDNEKGEDTLKCMANSPDAPIRCYNAAQPVGLYCYAATATDLTPCFSKLASAILRISK